MTIAAITAPSHQADPLARPLVRVARWPVEIVSKAGTAFLVSADQWRSLVETAHRLVYELRDEELVIVQARYHY
jgi:Txe/YoeB family toxin of Txe-Axe toxin-antitoxin module